jgi:hypothetical protein
MQELAWKLIDDSRTHLEIKVPPLYRTPEIGETPS